MLIFLSSTEVPGPVDMASVSSEVVDLLRVKLTWKIPNDNNETITMYTIEYCHVNSCNVITLPVNMTTTNRQDLGTASHILEHGAGLDTNISVLVSATNIVGTGGTDNGPVIVPVAKLSKTILDT